MTADFRSERAMHQRLERSVGSLPAYDPRDKTIGFVATRAKDPGRDAGATIAEWMIPR